MPDTANDDANTTNAVQKKKRKHEEIHQETKTKTKPHRPILRDLRFCPQCEKKKSFEEFSNSQRKKGGKGRCKSCVGSTSSTSTTTSSKAVPEAVDAKKQEQPPSKKQKKQPPPPKTVAAVVAKKQQKQKQPRPGSNPVCTACRRQKKPSAFPIDSPTKCVECIIDESPRNCRTCGPTKPKTKSDFSESNWELPYYLKGNRHGQKTIQQIKNMILARCGDEECKNCEANREQEERHAIAREKAMNKKHNIQFYDFGSIHPDDDRCSSTFKMETEALDIKKELLVGKTFDLIFINYYEYNDENLCRTTKGTVEFGETTTHQIREEMSDDYEEFPDSDIFNYDTEDEDDEEGNNNSNPAKTILRGDVIFHPDLRKADTGLQNISFVEDSRYGWVAWNPQVGFPKEANLWKVKKRTAMPWMKHECPGDDDDDDDSGEDKVKFATLAEAEALDRNHPDVSSWWLLRHKPFLSVDVAKRIHEYLCYKPRPVFFLEPGDLYLYVCWGEDHGIVGATTDCILRPRK